MLIPPKTRKLFSINHFSSLRENSYVKLTWKTKICRVVLLLDIFRFFTSRCDFVSRPSYIVHSLSLLIIGAHSQSIPCWYTMPCLANPPSFSFIRCSARSVFPLWCLGSSTTLYFMFFLSGAPFATYFSCVYIPVTFSRYAVDKRCAYSSQRSKHRMENHTLAWCIQIKRKRLNIKQGNKAMIMIASQLICQSHLAQCYSLRRGYQGLPIGEGLSMKLLICVLRKIWKIPI